MQLETFLYLEKVQLETVLVCAMGKRVRTSLTHRETFSHRCDGIGASECLERERGPGGPPSDQRERVYEVN